MFKWCLLSKTFFINVVYLSSRPDQNNWVHFLLLSLDVFLREGISRLISYHSALARFKGRTSGQSPWEVLRGHYGLLKNRIIKREITIIWMNSCVRHMCCVGFPGWFQGQPYEQWSSFEKALSILFFSCALLPYSWEAWANQEILSCLTSCPPWSFWKVEKGVKKSILAYARYLPPWVCRESWSGVSSHGPGFSRVLSFFSH